MQFQSLNPEHSRFVDEKRQDSLTHTSSSPLGIHRDRTHVAGDPLLKVGRTQYFVNL